MDINTVAVDIFDSMVSRLVQDVVARESVRMQSEPQEERTLPTTSGETEYVSCDRCGREVSANRFAAHLQKCLRRR